MFKYYEAKSLDKLLEERSLNSEQKRSIFKQVLMGVADAHQNNIVHRDLKPANILVENSGNVRLIDFGISKFKGSGLTVSGVIIGTLPYMAPELNFSQRSNPISSPVTTQPTKKSEMVTLIEQAFNGTKSSSKPKPVTVSSPSSPDLKEQLDRLFG